MTLATVPECRTLGYMASTDDAWKALAQTHELIKLADTKAGMILAASGVLGGLLLRAAPSPPHWTEHPLHISLLLLSVGLVAVSILLSLWVFVPRIRADGARSLLHFDNIARRYADPAEFLAASRSLFEHDERVQRALSEQLWATSHIARRKFRTVTPAIWFFGLGVLAALAAGVVS